MTVEQSPDIGELAKALVQFQAKMAPIAKTRTATVWEIRNGAPSSYTYTFADLSDIIEATRTARQEAGLAVSQPPVSERAGTVAIVTTLMHTSGQWMRSSLEIDVSSAETPPDVGSLISSYRRQCYIGALSLVFDDGTPRARVELPKAKANEIPHGGVFASPEKVRLLDALRRKIGGLTEDKYKRELGVYRDVDGKPITTSSELGEQQIDHMLDRLKAQYERQSQKDHRGIDLAALGADHSEEIGRIKEHVDGTTEREPEGV